MTGVPADLRAHLESGATSLSRCWRIVRRDGRVFAFTDHDLPISFGGATYGPSEALSARALEQTTGLSVDNSEAMGALSDAGLTENDIRAGRFDGAEVEIWLVNWSDPGQRMRLFRGEIGEIERAGGAFKAELRGLSERLNRPQGRLYQRQCRAVLGDRECGIDMSAPKMSRLVKVVAVSGTRVDLPELVNEEGWFANGRLVVLDGDATGDVRAIRSDQVAPGGRRVDLWESTGAVLKAGDRVRIEAGCDKSAATCRTKFANMVNFRGCPHLPDEDWLMSYPVSGDAE